MTPSQPHPTTILAGYEGWLSRQPLAANTRRAYLTQARQFCSFLEESPDVYHDALVDARARDYAVRDYKTHLKTVRKLKPTTVNLALAALDHFYSFLHLGQAAVQREALPQQAPRALNPAEQKAFRRAVERCSSIRDRAVAVLLFFTGIRVGECSSLDVGDVLTSARKGKIIVRSGKGDAYREVPLNSEAREACRAWAAERKRQFGGTQEQAFFLNRTGSRLSTRAIDLLLRKIGADAGLALSAHVLRHTCLTSLVRRGNDLILVAEIAGHRRLETTRRYSLPTEQDRAAAMEALRIDY